MHTLTNRELEIKSGTCEEGRQAPQIAGHYQNSHAISRSPVKLLLEDCLLL